MWMTLLTKYWKEALIGAIIVTLLGYIWMLKSENADLHILEVKQHAKIKEYESTINSNKVDLDARTELVTKYVDKVRTEYKDRVEIIYKEVENNATCHDAMQYLNSYNY